jgi:membrane carboxypeptidase/penicillin-binding protein PbpC
MTLRKRLIKFTIWIVLICISGLFLTYYYLKSTWTDVLTEEALTEFVTKIKFAEELPDRFYELYELEYPNALSYGVNQQLLKGMISNNSTKSPSILAAMISEISRKDSDSTKISNRKAYTLAWKLEAETTQKECLNWVLDNYKFDLYIHGLEEIASFYYKKNISELSDSELSDVITLMKKPSIINVPNREEIEQH